MKTRFQTVLLSLFMLLAFSATAQAAAIGSDPSRVLRQPSARGAHLEVTVLDAKGRPVAGTKLTATASDLSQLTAVTGPDGVAVLDGLPENCAGTVHAADKKLRPVNWNVRIQAGKFNHLTVRYNVLCYGVTPRKYRTPLVVKLLTEQPRFEQRWAPVHYDTALWDPQARWPVSKGKEWPVRADRLPDDSSQELEYLPLDARGQITQAYFRPWGSYQGGADMPMSTWWHVSVYDYVNCDKKASQE